MPVGGADATLGALGQYLPYLLIFVALFVFMILPQRKKDKQIKQMIASVKKGDRLTTIGGVYGRVVDVNEKYITLEVGPDKAKLVFARWGIREIEKGDVTNDVQPS